MKWRFCCLKVWNGWQSWRRVDSNIYFWYLFIFVVLSLHWCTQAFSSCREWGLFSSCSALASQCGSLCCGGADFRHTSCSGCGLQALARGLNSCGAQAQLLHGMWNLPGPGIKPMTPALAGRFLSTAPPGKPKNSRILHTWLVRPSRYLPKCDVLCRKMGSN